ncbi:uncharacterized protein [Macrobrachium rosenbergii]|uniref:uncharacterized protein n=1 Tax=Macrobrachium rosenbergii TaxID=79674 RepID=UPI0034D569DC
MERLFTAMLVILAILRCSFSDQQLFRPPGSPSSAREIHHTSITSKEFSNFTKFRKLRSSLAEEALTDGERKPLAEFPPDEYFSTKYINISEMESQMPLEDSTVAVGRGILHRLHSRVLTSTVTTNTTVTKFFTCTTEEPSVIPTCTNNARSLGHPTFRLPIESTSIYNPDSYKKSHSNVNLLETSFKAHDFQETQRRHGTGRFLITIHHSKVLTTTYVNTVTQIDYASTVSIIYRGCKPSDTVDAPICGAPHYPPCYYGYHGHYNYYTYYCSPNAYTYQGPHGYYCPDGDFCGKDPTDPAAQIAGDPAAAVLAEPAALEPSPVIAAARLDLPVRKSNASVNELLEVNKRVAGNAISQYPWIPGHINHPANHGSKDFSETVLGGPGLPVTSQVKTSPLVGAASVPTSKILVQQPSQTDQVQLLVLFLSMREESLETSKSQQRRYRSQCKQRKAKCVDNTNVNKICFLFPIFPTFLTFFTSAIDLLFPLWSVSNFCFVIFLHFFIPG